MFMTTSRFHSDCEWKKYLVDSFIICIYKLSYFVLDSYIYLFIVYFIVTSYDVSINIRDI